MSCPGRHCAHDLYCMKADYLPSPVAPVPMPTWPAPNPQCTCGVFYHSVIPMVCPVHPTSSITITCGTISADPTPHPANDYEVTISSRPAG